MSNEITVRQQQVQNYTFSDLERMAKAVAGSGLFGVKTEQQALSLMLLAQAEGLHPAIAARDYHIIEGKPSLKADTMLARFQAAGGKVQWHANTDKIADATFTPPHGEPLRMQWTHEMAVTAKLMTKDVWIKYERSMLRSRLTSEAIRTVYPQVIAGTYTPEELSDSPELRDITPPRDTIEIVQPDRGEARVADAEYVDKETGEIIGKAETDQPVQGTIVDEPKMDPKQVNDFLTMMADATTLTELKDAHAKAYTAAHKAGDGRALLQFAVASDAKKYKLTKGGAK